MKVDFKNTVNTVCEHVLAFFYPPQCSCCGNDVEPGRLICMDCMEELERLRLKSPRTLKHKGRQFKLNSIYAYVSGNAASTIVKRLKYLEKLSCARFMGAMIAQKASRLKNDYDVVTYVPMTRMDELNRGFNQCEYISAEVARVLKLPQTVLLVKRKNTKPQHRLTANERRANLDGAFKAKRKAAGKRILLIDDVITSGTTLCECADALCNAGAQSVTLLSFSMVRRSH